MIRLSASVVILLIIGAAVFVSALQVRELGWEDLVGTFEFEDPFEQLTSEQVYDLGTYVRVTKLKEADPSSVTQSMEDEIREAKERLAAGGVDIDHLISIAPEVKKQRLKRATAVVPELNGQQVKLLKLGRMPAVLLIDKVGQIRYRHYANSMRDIPPNDEILALLDQLDKFETK